MSNNPLYEVDKGLWCLELHFVAWGCKGSVRMTLIETRGGVVIYSPVTLTQSHIEQIERIGPVSTIMAPNLFHHLFLRPCIAAFPNARVLISRGTGREDRSGPRRGGYVGRAESRSVR